MKKSLLRGLLASTCIIAAGLIGSGEAFAGAAGIPTAADGIGGVVTSTKGPEAGVWVIAETHDLPTRFIKMVVTDDQGRFFMPELPKGNYEIWVRGYGLVDSPKQKAAPGKNMNLTAVVAPDAKAAAQYYPANYWFSLIQPPAANEFPGTGPKGNGISPNIPTQQQWIRRMKGCMTCHQQGDQTTRNLESPTPEGWAERINKARGPGDQAVADHGPEFAKTMNNGMTSFGRARGLAMWADWTARIAKGAVPEAPPRPQGIERNIVLTSWDWATGRYNHDEISTDRLNPTVNANGPIYGVIPTWGYMVTLNPKTHEANEIGYKVDQAKSVKLEKGAVTLLNDEAPDAFPHNPMLDAKGRLWVTERGRYGAPRPNDVPVDKAAYCTDPNFKYAKWHPQPGRASRTAVIYDPKTHTVEGIPMCNDIHHLMYGRDNKTMYFSDHANGGVFSWVDVEVWDKTKDPRQAMGWCPFVVDTNGDGKISQGWTVFNRGGGGGDGEEGGGGGARLPINTTVDPTKDTRIVANGYSIDVDLSADAMWLGSDGPFPTAIARVEKGANPPETCRTEWYEPPLMADGKNYGAHTLRGMSADSKGIAWAAFNSGQLGRFDRSKCKVTKGPTVVGQQCPEGWSFWDSPGPKISGQTVGSADFHYLMWTDLFNTLGLGKDIPIVAGSNSDSLLAFHPDTQKWTVLRVPYPRSFHTRGMDGRIDDPNGGWKGRGIYATYASQPVWHQEGGEDGTSGPQLVKFQVRPDPLAN